jgi:hypothetical protein
MSLGCSPELCVQGQYAAMKRTSEMVDELTINVQRRTIGNTVYELLVERDSLEGKWTSTYRAGKGRFRKAGAFHSLADAREAAHAAAYSDAGIRDHVCDLSCADGWAEHGVDIRCNP